MRTFIYFFCVLIITIFINTVQSRYIKREDDDNLNVVDNIETTNENEEKPSKGITLKDVLGQINKIIKDNIDLYEHPEELEKLSGKPIKNEENTDLVDDEENIDLIDDEENTDLVDDEETTTSVEKPKSKKEILISLLDQINQLIIDNIDTYDDPEVLDKIAEAGAGRNNDFILSHLD